MLKPNLTQLIQQIKQSGNFKLTVTVTPKSQQNQILNYHFDLTTGQYSLKAKIRGIPENGQVNANLIKFLAQELSLSPSSITIISGHTSRQKIISINAL